MLLYSTLQFLYGLSFTKDLDPSAIAFAIQSLDHADPLVVSAALQVLLKNPHPELISEVCSRIPFKPFPVQKVMIVSLCTCFLSDPYIYLLDSLKTFKEEVAGFSILCLSRTDYPITHLILPRLNTSNIRYKERLKQLLLKLGFRRIEPALALYPVLPHEVLLRELFGNESIESLFTPRG